MAKKLVDAGCRGVEDLRLPQFHSMLTKTQKLSLQYETHLQQPVTRAEAEAVAVSEFLFRSSYISQLISLPNTDRISCETTSLRSIP